MAEQLSPTVPNVHDGVPIIDDAEPDDAGPAHDIDTTEFLKERLGRWKSSE